MSNVMSMKSIKNHVHRDGFDLSRKFAFSAKLGELLPVFVEDVFPGDKFKISADWFTRTQPVTSPAYTRFGEYYDFFFVPYHLLWRYFPQFIIQTDDDNWATGITSKSNKFTQHPYMSSKEVLSCIRNAGTFGSNDTLTGSKVDVNNFTFSYGALKLLEYLGYGKTSTKNYQTSAEGKQAVYPLDSVISSANSNDVALNPFPLAAYQKVYADFFRNTQWETTAPYSYNFDYLNQSNMKVPLPTTPDLTFTQNGLLTLRYTNFNKDYFLGRLPEKQYGTEALASPLVDTDGNRYGVGIIRTGGVGGSDSNRFRFPLFSISSAQQAGNLAIDPAAVSKTNFGIGALAIRQAEFLQKWKEITQSGGTDYVSQIQKHFGIKPNSEMAHRSTYIGGFDKKFGIDEVVNTNLASAESETNLLGKGVNAGHGAINFDVKEHGIIIGVYHMSLLPEYTSQMTDKLITKTMPTDYVIPELDNIGMQAVYAQEFAGYLIPSVSSKLDKLKSIIGYVPRYAEYKTKVDKVAGVFSESLYNWVTPLNKITATSIKNGDFSFIDDSFFYKINPHILDSVFSVMTDSTCDTDQFLVNCGFDVKAVRNISRDGLPY